MRDRPEDIEPLVAHLCKKYLKETGVRKRFLLRTIRRLENPSSDRHDPNPGPYIDPLNDITLHGRDLFPFIRDILEQDQAYVNRLKQHYSLMKECFSKKKDVLH